MNNFKVKGKQIKWDKDTLELIPALKWVQKKAICPNGPLSSHKRHNYELKLTDVIDEPIEFDALFPVYVPSDKRGQEFEPEFGSTQDVDDFVGSLPVKQMLEVDTGYIEHEKFTHEFCWMVQWLNTSMEISQISVRLLHARLQYLEKNLGEMQLKLAKHKSHYQDMVRFRELDNYTNAAEEAISKHAQEGFQAEKHISFIVILIEAIKIVIPIAGDLDLMLCTMTPCECNQCEHYRSPGRRAPGTDMKTLKMKTFNMKSLPDDYLGGFVLNADEYTRG
ncbi:hypothetical protein PR002_g28164 [Phytophthora rubi]|uniref:Uncharacterized protein n=1 Tax=Phytophthora rubi TaxID=129364 RepID=A0A6A3HE32_9STRA|nr:hypothetical protein PR002_g28164 [Phytophthora rubi]